MSALLSSEIASSGPAPVLRPMTLATLDAVMAMEVEVYPFPWTRGNFVDSLAAGHLAWTLDAPGEALLGYCVAMDGVAETHLLNITVAPRAQRRGHARQMIAALAAHCRARGAGRLWLEVRQSNDAGRATYRRLGFTTAGVRKGYYPAPDNRREDAEVMSLAIDAETDGALD